MYNELLLIVRTLHRLFLEGPMVPRVLLEFGACMIWVGTAARIAFPTQDRPWMTVREAFWGVIAAAITAAWSLHIALTMDLVLIGALIFRMASIRETHV